MKKLHFALIFCFVFVACAESPKGEQAEKETGAIKEKIADTLITPPASNEEKVEEVPETVLEATDNDGNPVTVTIRAEADALDSLGYIKITLPNDSVKGYLFEAHPWHETVFGPSEDYDGNTLEEADLSMTPWYRITSLSPLAIEFHVTFENLGLKQEHDDYKAYSLYFSGTPYSPSKENKKTYHVSSYSVSDTELTLHPYVRRVNDKLPIDSLYLNFNELIAFQQKKDFKPITIYSTYHDLKLTADYMFLKFPVERLKSDSMSDRYLENYSSLVSSFPSAISN